MGDRGVNDGSKTVLYSTVLNDAIVPARSRRFKRQRLIILYQRDDGNGE